MECVNGSLCFFRVDSNINTATNIHTRTHAHTHTRTHAHIHISYHHVDFFLFFLSAEPTRVCSVHVLPKKRQQNKVTFFLLSSASDDRIQHPTFGACLRCVPVAINIKRKRWNHKSARESSKLTQLKSHVLFVAPPLELLQDFLLPAASIPRHPSWRL